MKILILEEIIIIMTLCIYLSGFMDLKTNTSNSERDVDFRKMAANTLYKSRPIKYTVIMIIDGLRTDHLVNSNKHFMKFSRELLRSGKGIGYFLHTETPTVTLPRIKSLLTGMIPGFMDVIFNFASKELMDENLVDFWKNSGYKIQFYGDDTWLGLFPNSFDQWKGVTSFYVSDYTYVDNNVTEQLKIALPQSSWDIMILHYLGLDHIGHIGGPVSGLIPTKLKEMDSIVRNIYEELEKKNETYLLLLCGDHGMSDSGGHGGASASEIMTSAMLVSNIFQTEEKIRMNFVHQVDLASTLAIMTGVRIPNKNIGVPVDPVLDSLPLEMKVAAERDLSAQLIANSLPYLSKYESEDIKSKFSQLDLMQKFVSNKCTPPKSCQKYEEEMVKLSNGYSDLQRKASYILADNKHSYDMFLIILAVFAIFMVSVTVLAKEVLINLRDKRSRMKSVFVIYIILFIIIYFLKDSFKAALILATSLSFGAVRAILLLSAVRPTTMLKPTKANFNQLFIYSFVILHPFSLLATSFVEEEHQVFYFIISSLHCLFMVTLLNKRFHPVDDCSSYVSYLFSRIQSVSRFVGEKLFTGNKKSIHMVAQSCIVILSWATFRHLRYYNVTGDKWRHLIYFNNILNNLPENMKYPLFLCTYIFSAATYSPFMASLLLLGELMSHSSYRYVHFVYNVATHYGPYPLIFIIFINSTILIPTIRHFMKRRIGKVETFTYFISCFESFFALLFVVLQKRENYPCTFFSFLSFNLLLYLLVRFKLTLRLSDECVAIVVLWLAEAHFFSHGNSNSLTTVRIAAGFVGMTTYSPIIHGILIAIHTFGIKIIIYLHFIRLSISSGKDIYMCTKILRCWWIMRLIVLNVYIFVVTIQRYHLFVWSVFAPKLLYEGCHVICLLFVTILSFVAKSIAEGEKDLFFVTSKLTR